MHRMVAIRLTKVWALWKVWNGLPPGKIRTTNSQHRRRKSRKEMANGDCIEIEQIETASFSSHIQHRIDDRNPMENFTIPFVLFIYDFVR